MVTNRSHQAKQLHPSTIHLRDHQYRLGRICPCLPTSPVPSGSQMLTYIAGLIVHTAVTCGPWYFHLFCGNDRVLRASETQPCKKSSILSNRILKIPCEHRQYLYGHGFEAIDGVKSAERLAGVHSAHGTCLCSTRAIAANSPAVIWNITMSVWDITANKIERRTKMPTLPCIQGGW
jgi:hypothetical protein